MRASRLLIPLAATALLLVGCASEEGSSTATSGEPAELCSFDESVDGVTAVQTGDDGSTQLTVAKDAKVPEELVVVDLCQGVGVEATPQSAVTADYVGVGYKTREVFDSSFERGEPATFPLSQVIPGWTEGVAGMKPGGARLLLIPSDLAYGPTGRPPAIQENEALAFIVEIVEIQEAPQ